MERSYAVVIESEVVPERSSFLHEVKVVGRNRYQSDAIGSEEGGKRTVGGEVVDIPERLAQVGETCKRDDGGRVVLPHVHVELTHKEGIEVEGGNGVLQQIVL